VSGSIHGSSKVTVGNGVNPAVLTASGTLASTAFDVQASGRLEGGGTLNGAVTVENGGTLAPIASTAGLTLQTGSLTLQSGSTLQLALSHSAGPSRPLAGDYSKLTLGSDVAVTLDGSLAINISGSLALLDLFTIIQGSTIPVQGTFSNITTQVAASTWSFTAGGTEFLINYKFNAAGFDGSASSFEGNSNGTSVALLVVPEPDAFAMLAGGFGLSVGLQRFRRRGARIK
jgi:hypothetical protein